MPIRWRDGILNTPILRGRGDGTQAAQLQGIKSAKRLKSLGEQMGYTQTAMWYWLRRLVLNAADGQYLEPRRHKERTLVRSAGFGSEKVRIHVAGHLDSRTSYL